MKIQIVLYLIHVIKNYWVHIIYKELIDYYFILVLFMFFFFLFILLNQFK